MEKKRKGVESTREQMSNAIRDGNSKNERTKKNKNKAKKKKEEILKIENTVGGAARMAFDGLSSAGTWLEKEAMRLHVGQ